MANQDEEDKGGAPLKVSRRGFVAQVVVGATILVAPSVVTAAPPTAEMLDGKTPSDPAPSKSSWNVPPPSRSSDMPIPSRSAVPVPSRSSMPLVSSPPRSNPPPTRPTGREEPAPAQPGAPSEPNALFDFFL